MAVEEHNFVNSFCVEATKTKTDIWLVYLAHGQAYGSLQLKFEL